MNTLIYSFWISLFDSLSTTLQIIAFILLLTTAKPLRNALVYLAGLSGAYFLCGLAGYLTLDQLKALLNQFFPSQVSIPNAQYYESEFLVGVIMVGLGIWYFHKKKKQGWSGAENKILLKLKSMNGWFAFGIGVLISVSSFPCSIPYLIVLGKYAALHLDLPTVAAFILFYNFGYALPMLLILVIYLFARQGTEDDHDTLHEKAKMLNLHLTTWTMVGFGVFSMIDAGCYFAIGHALLKERYF
jgi:cytochrome c biogenesis protein CcdA